MKFSTMKALFGNAGKGKGSSSTQPPTGELPSPDYNDFNYWKPNLPDIDAEITVLVGEKPKAKKGGKQTIRAAVTPDEDLSQFNTFNFWKEPLPDIDLANL